MAIQNKTIHNPKTGQAIRFIRTAKDSNGQLLEMETTYQAHSREPAAHYHPHQQEDFTVLSGQLTVKINGQRILLQKGDSLHIPANQVHAMWNSSTEKTVVNWKVQPALNSEYFLETAMGLAVDGKTNEAGMPSVLQVALMADNYSDEFRLSKPSYAVQTILFAILKPFAYLLGYKPSYRKYID